MADKRRFDLFADLLVTRFPQALRVYDIAGGMGKLNESLTQRGRTVTTFDLRHKHLPVKYAQRLFTLEEPCEAELVVGMHPDGATRIIIEYAARHGLGFAVVPCCSDNGMPYKPWMRHLADVARDAGFTAVEEAELPMDGRARVLLGVWR
ncbi:hypothetical protein KH5H1_02460 [Corallococcus caeni]|uniref:Class I SAM-dependent methyltransferase n=2 Tax=Corallococcus TaxID=83461 RepID=A0A7Y4JMT8_9BACT|nr:hypothetical protein [Corallococcus exercitus]NOK07905.1 hypothetical protein [Corallococcus exercitus]GMT96127.1 hypothetical protein KH5H1_02460 [Corallococcus sp. KH5-1]GMU07955.1 hypothetical protein ASNO1_42080 [Corallococcus sp. NO1]